MTRWKLRFLQALPYTFQRKEAVIVGKTVYVAERTVGKYLHEFTEGGFIIRDRHGYYIKTNLDPLIIPG